jgi:hypothetical protein
MLNPEILLRGAEKLTSTTGLGLPFGFVSSKCHVPARVGADVGEILASLHLSV